MRNMFNAAVTMGQLQNRIDITANNLANLNTYGYKANHANFASLMYQQVNNILHHDADSPRETPVGIRVGSGARLTHTTFNMNNGTIQHTNRDLDVAIQDQNRFFVVNAPAENGGTETRYTRAGNFYIQPINDDEVMLTTSEGFPVEGQNGPIILADDFDAISINAQGGIDITRGNATQTEAYLQVVDFERTRGLEAAGANTYRLNEDALGVPAEEFVFNVAPANANLVPGAVEASNVDMAKEFAELIESQRAYSFNARSVSIGDQMMGLISNMRS
ncbi:flagellar hook-basal body protein [Bacillaceae bacterium W0354]